MKKLLLAFLVIIMLFSLFACAPAEAVDGNEEGKIPGVVESIFVPEYDGLSGQYNVTVKPWQFFICLVEAFVLGFVIAVCYMIKNEYSRSLVITVVLLPPIVSVLIMLVSGSMGAAIAVGGVFALTRFRSNQGTSRELTHILLAMATGLTLGLGYVWVAAILVAFVETISVLFNVFKFGEANQLRRILKVTIPEELDYTDLFDDLFEKYTTKSMLVKVKLKNLGTLFQLTYDIVLKDQKNEKQFIDEIRVRNANLDVLCSRIIANPDDL